jgi:hypothetical protein
MASAATPPVRTAGLHPVRRAACPSRSRTPGRRSRAGPPPLPGRAPGSPPTAPPRRRRSAPRAPRARSRASPGRRARRGRSRRTRPPEADWSRSPAGQLRRRGAGRAAVRRPAASRRASPAARAAAPVREHPVRLACQWYVGRRSWRHAAPGRRATKDRDRGGLADAAARTRSATRPARPARSWRGGRAVRRPGPGRYPARSQPGPG